VRYVNDHQGPAAALKITRHFLDTYKNWSEENIQNVTLSKLMDNLAKETSTLTTLSYDDLRKEVAHFSVTDNATRRWIKYAMGTLHIASAPYISNYTELFT
jgi:hypothetical protein